MNNMKERILYAVYVQGKGFLKKGGRLPTWSDDFAKCKLFSAKHHARACYACKNNEEVTFVPIKVTLDPEDVFKLVLGFK